MSRPPVTNLQQASADLYRALQAELAKPSSIAPKETAELFEHVRLYIGRNLGEPAETAFVRGDVS